MRLHLIAAGRFDRQGPERALYEHYAARLAPFAGRLALGPLQLTEVVPRGQSEIDALAAAVPSGGVPVIALDSRGQALTSEDFAALLARLRDGGSRAAAFLIGGADGLGALYDTAAHRISFGNQTWPHLLVRGLLAEQLYRAATILAGHPYHRGH